MRRVALILGLAAAVLGRAAEPTQLGHCLSMPQGPERVTCIESAFGQQPLGEHEIALLAKLVAEEPGTVERVATAAEAALRSAATPSAEEAGGSADHARAELLDLRGQALERLGRAAEAADAFHAALALDDGTARVTWLGEDGRVEWTVSVDPGEGRQERAAQSYLSAGRPEGARALLAHALASGAEGWAREGWAQVGGGSVPGLDASASDLSARTWFPPLPDLEVKLHDGGSFPLSSARGKVLLLDFWASWCAPCLHEIPKLQSLYDSQKDAGLVVLTINTRESVQTARSVAENLGLRLPIGFYDAAADQAFNVRALPTVILVDRDGRMRFRWDNYAPDFDGEVGAKVRALLVKDADGASRKVADILAGSGLLRIEWLRELAGPIGGVAVVSDAKGEPRIAATSGDQLLTVRANGRIDERHPLQTVTAGKLRRTGDIQGRFDLVSFRPGGKDVVWIDSKSGASHAWSTSAPVLDVAVLPPSPPAFPGARLILGGVEGVSTADASGQETPWKEAAGETCCVASVPGGSSPRVAALARSGRLLWLDPQGRVLSRQWATAGSRGLLLAGEAAPGVGLLPSAAVAGVVGRFIEGERAQVAVATAAGQLVLADLVTGEVRFRARWPGITELAAGDLHGDGRDELLVAVGRSLAVLGRPRGEAAHAGP